MMITYLRHCCDLTIDLTFCTVYHLKSISNGFVRSSCVFGTPSI